MRPTTYLLYGVDGIAIVDLMADVSDAATDWQVGEQRIVFQDLSVTESVMLARPIHCPIDFDPATGSACILRPSNVGIAEIAADMERLGMWVAFAEVWPVQMWFCDADARTRFELAIADRAIQFADVDIAD